MGSTRGAVRGRVWTAMFAAIAVVAGCGGDDSGPPPPVASETFTLPSTRVGDDFSLRVRLPEAAAPAGGYPLVLVLDGDWDFDPAAAALAEMARQGRVPEALLVGIGYGAVGDAEISRKRERDYTPATPEDPAGRAQAFLGFLDSELIPELARRYPITTELGPRGFIGYSYGGLCGAQALLHDPPIAGRFALGSPSLWYDDWRVFDIERDYAAAHQDLPADVVMESGFEDATGHVVGIKALAEQLRARGYPSLRVRWSVIPGETHDTLWYSFHRAAVLAVLEPR